MHPGLAALAEEQPPAGRTFGALLSYTKRIFANRENLKLQVGRVRVLARTFFSPSAFSKPETRTEWLSRVQTNASHYWRVYGIIFVCVLVYTILSSPLLLVGLAMLGAVWAYAFLILAPDTALTVFGFELRRREKLLALVPFSLLVVALTGELAPPSPEPAAVLSRGDARPLTPPAALWLRHDQLAHLGVHPHLHPRLASRLLPRGRRARRA